MLKILDSRLRGNDETGEFLTFCEAAISDDLAKSPKTGFFSDFALAISASYESSFLIFRLFARP